MIEELKIKTIPEQELKKLKQEIELRIKEEVRKPFIISIMGQTGVGKSSLINALFKTNLKTDPLRPCTQEIECVIAENEHGNQLWFYDLPGIGESEEVDDKYIQQYRQVLIESDVVMWAIIADSRSISLDFKALRQVLHSQQKQESELINKIIVVLTKADLLTPEPWILGTQESQNSAFFYPQGKTEEILSKKSEYYQNLFNYFYKKINVEVIDNSLQVIPCSAKFRYNLPQLMQAIVKKMKEESVLRFEKLYGNQFLSKLTPSEAKKFKNFTIIDLDKK